MNDKRVLQSTNFAIEHLWLSPVTEPMAGAAAAIAAHRVYVRKFGREDELGEHLAGDPDTSTCQA